MIRLKLFGAPALVGPGGIDSSLLAQPKRLGLLAYIATSTGVHSRDTLLAVFWPELDERHARASLRQSLYNVRHSVGPGAICVRGKTQLLVDESKLSCDAVEFCRLLEAERDDNALTLYAGPFMDGFHLPDMPEFQHWLDDQRRYFERCAVAAAWRLAQAQQAAGDAAGSRRWAERAIELAPYDEEGFRRYMQLLANQGNRALALLAYERLVASLRADLDVSASRETIELGQRLYLQVPGIETASDNMQHVGNVTSANGVAARTSQDGPPLIGNNAPAEAHVRRHVRLRPRVIASTAAGVLALLAYGYHAHSSAPARTRAPIRSLVVLPLSTAGDDVQQHYFADEMTDALTAELGQVSSVSVISLTTANQFRGVAQPIPTIARRLNVDAAVEGSVALHDGSVRVNVRLIEGPTDRQLWSHTYEEDLSDVLSVQREIAHSVADQIRLELNAEQTARLRRARSR